MTTKHYERPVGAYEGESGLNYRTKYQDDSATVPRVPIASRKVDGDINYLLDAVNELYDTAVTGTLPDNSVTLAKLSHLTAGSMYYMDGSGTPTELAVGTTGQTLQVTGGVPTWATVAQAVPSGALMPYVANAAPSGWLLCDGSAVSRATYAGLFAVCGTAYGAGDGSTTFNLPDLRGRVALGRDNMGGTSANRVTDTEADTLGGTNGAESFSGNTGGHALTIDEMPDHDHSLPANVGKDTDAKVGSDGLQQGGSTTTGSTGGGAEHDHTVDLNLMNPYLTLSYIIKT